MSNTTINLEPRDVWAEFERISAIPRGSKNETQILAYLKTKAQRFNYPVKEDQVGNLVVILPASPGKEDSPTTILQAHVDMVCEQNRGRNHDFLKDPIELVIDDEWLTARDTTLGADNGIAVAYMSTLMNGGYSHGQLELLFTIDEETGLTGALQLDPSILTGTRLINIDTEEEGHFCIGCAGGKETIGTYNLERDTKGEFPTSELWELEISGLRGGHSGADIHMELGNPLVLSGRILNDILTDPQVRLVSVQGGDKHNAIPREAFSLLYIQDSEGVLAKVSRWQEIFRNELGVDDKNIVVNMSRVDSSKAMQPLTKVCQTNILRFLLTCPHGIFGWSRSIPGLVSTSTNLAALKIDGDVLKVLTSQRSDQESQRDMIADKTSAIMELCGFQTKFTREYPGWTPNPSSPLLQTCLQLYPEICSREASIQSIHAGLECGVIGDRIPGIDMISFGPDIEAPHTPGERVKIKSVARVWNFLVALLATL